VLAAVDRPAGHAVLNVGAGAPVRLDALAEAVARVVGRPVPLDRRPPAPGDVPLTWADPSRAREVLGWVPQVGLAEGLARTVAWFDEGEP
jgi:UDP-glucose 4-epimerase